MSRMHGKMCQSIGGAARALPHPGPLVGCIGLASCSARLLPIFAYIVCFISTATVAWQQLLLLRGMAGFGLLCSGLLLLLRG